MDNRICSPLVRQNDTFTCIFITIFAAFCSGEILNREGSHWTQMEQSAFPDQGKFYCGDCCGQHLAWQACNQQWKQGPPGCINWVQCFQRECRVSGVSGKQWATRTPIFTTLSVKRDPVCHQTLLCSTKDVAPSTLWSIRGL